MNIQRFSTFSKDFSAFQFVSLVVISIFMVNLFAFRGKIDSRKGMFLLDLGVIKSFIVGFHGSRESNVAENFSAFIISMTFLGIQLQEPNQENKSTRVDEQGFLPILVICTLYFKPRFLQTRLHR